MRELHPDVAHTATEVIIKETEGFRLRMERWESVSPKGLFAVDLIQEALDDDGEVWQSSTYSFNMTKEQIEEIINDVKNLNDIPNQKLISYMDTLSEEFEVIKSNIINLTYQLDSVEILYNKLLNEYEKRV